MDEHVSKEAIEAANGRLRTCPFCGAKAHIMVYVFHGLPNTYGVRCGKCHAESYQFYDTIDEAVAAWNTRHANGKPAIHGKWIWDVVRRVWECDQCGETTTESVMYKPRFRFCPWCGADMRKEGNDER